MSPKPARPPKVDPTKGAALQRLLAADDTLPPPHLQLRFDGKTPTAKALKAAGLPAKDADALAAELAKRGGELMQRIGTDRAFAQQLADDVPGALRTLGVSKALASTVQQPAASVLERFAGVDFRIPGGTTQSGSSQQAAVQLLTDTLAAARGNPALEAGLRTDPQPQVAAAAAANPPVGFPAGSAALASVVTEVSTALLRAAGGSGGSSGSNPLYPDLSDVVATDVRTVKIPTPRSH